MLRTNYLIATIYDQILFYTSSESLADRLTQAFTLLLPLGGIVAIPFVGYLLDKRSSKSAFAVLLLTGIGFGVLGMIPGPVAQVMSIVFFVVQRPLMCKFLYFSVHRSTSLSLSLLLK